MLTEKHLQSFWSRQPIQHNSFSTVCGKPIQLLDPGQLNNNQGPDFINARIKIGGVIWAGNIELHIKTSDWLKHHHQYDPIYQQIILHVVWVHDCSSFDVAPVMVLSNYFTIKEVLKQTAPYGHFQLHCNGREQTIITMASHHEFNALGLTRLADRRDQVCSLFQQTKQDHASVLWRLIFRCFGRTANADAFESLFTSIPIHVLRLYAFDQQLLEAILLGQAKLLNDRYQDEYFQSLFHQYQVIKERHQLFPSQITMKWLRMRPRNFPTIRIAQLAAFYHAHFSIVQELLAKVTIKEVDEMFNLEIQSYWMNHYSFDRLSAMQYKEIGKVLRHQIILHAFIPFLLAYGTSNANPVYTKRALNWYFNLPPEQNALVHAFNTVGFRATNINDTQSLHQLFELYCKKRACHLCLRGKLLGLS